MVKKVFQLSLLLIIIELVICKPCPGKCVPEQNITSSCKSKGGQVVGYCTTELACCDFTSQQVGTCGSTKSGLNSATFQSPNYPEFSSGDLSCNFHFNLSNQQFDGLHVEFLDVYTDGMGFAHHSPCEIDMIFLRGFFFWQPPPRCGNLTGYSVVIDKTKNTNSMKSLEILALMSSFRYKWKIRVSILKNSKAMESSTTDQDDESSFTEPSILHSNADQTKEEKLTFEDSEESDFQEPLIVNGVDTDITEVPWQASLRQFYPDYYFHRLKISLNESKIYNQEKAGCSVEGRHFCGASIISDQHVLTASHCFYALSKTRGWKKLDSVKVFLGETDLCLDDREKYGRSPQNFSIEKIIFHYAYDDINVALHDVVILKLKGKIKFDENIKPIALSKRFKDYDGLSVKASGWGLTNLTEKGVSIPLILQSADGIFVGNQSYCSRHLEKGFGVSKRVVEGYPKYYGSFSSVLCTLSKNDSISKLVGQADSGGPLIYFDTSHKPPLPTQVGIVSYGLPALEAMHQHDNVFVDYFQNVAYYRNWIDLAMSV